MLARRAALCLFACASLLASGKVLACGEGATPCVLDGRALVDATGVNTHFVDPSTPYAAHRADLLRLMQQAHLRHIRDAAIDDHGGPSPADQAALFRTLALAGIRADLLVHTGVSDGFLAGLAARTAPAVESYEAPNEANDGHDPAWAEHLHAWLPQLRRDAGGVPVIGPALILLGAGVPGDNAYATLGDQSAWVAFGNVHDYASGFSPGTAGWGGAAAPPCQAWRYGAIGFSLCAATAAFPGRPMMATEYGWATAGGHGAVPEAVQARYVVRGVLLHAMAGVVRTYLYQLMDAGGDAGASMGLLHADLSPKPAFTALAGLLGLADAPAAGGPAPHIRLSGDLAAVRSTLLRRRDGPGRLVAWVEQPGFDPDADGGRGRILAVAPRHVLVHGLRAAAPVTVRRFDGQGWTASSLAPKAERGGATLALDLTDSLTVIDLQ